MKRKFKVMLACESEDGKGKLCPLLGGDVSITCDPEANNFEAMQELSRSIALELHKLKSTDVLQVVNKLMLDQ
jgi:hypothetical protein